MSITMFSSDTVTELHYNSEFELQSSLFPNSHTHSSLSSPVTRKPNTFHCLIYSRISVCNQCTYWEELPCCLQSNGTYSFIPQDRKLQSTTDGILNSLFNSSIT